MSAFDDMPLPDIPGGQIEPVFLEPWHAEIFSLAVALNRKGVFTWCEWVDSFTTAMREIPADEGEGPETAYYRRWLVALERLVAQRGLSSSEEMARRKEEWRRAYLRTPHGQPIALERGLEVVDPRHHEATHANSHASGRHAARPEPIAVSAARVAIRTSASSTRAV
jgi:nitrile hydratase accessory protein